jgi:dUTP pyrophosphatase
MEKIKMEERQVVFVKILKAGAEQRSYANPSDAGADLRSAGDYRINPGESKLIKTGIAIELPFGYEAQVRPRSGLAYKNQVTVLNTPGTIDEGYRGEVGVILINHGKDTFLIDKGDRIAQLVVKPVEQVRFIIKDELSDTSRGEGGFGSTGRS